MAHDVSSLFDDLDVPAQRAGKVWGAPLRTLKRLTLGLSRRRGVEANSAEATTLPPPSRGLALREAHRTLRQRLRSHEALRQLMPHLACIERKLAKHGSAALKRLPVPVLERGLAQLAQLQRDDEPPVEAANLRVLRLRLIEAIALRSASQDPLGTAGRPSAAAAQPPASRRAAVPADASAVEVSEVSSSTFSEAALDWDSRPGGNLHRH